MEMKSFDDYSKTAKLIYISEIFFDDIVITKQVYLSLFYIVNNALRYNIYLFFIDEDVSFICFVCQE